MEWVDDYQKRERLFEILMDKNNANGRTLIFVDTKRMADTIDDYLYEGSPEIGVDFCIARNPRLHSTYIISCTTGTTGISRALPFTVTALNGSVKMHWKLFGLFSASVPMMLTATLNKFSCLLSLVL